MVIGIAASVPAVAAKSGADWGDPVRSGVALAIRDLNALAGSDAAHPRFVLRFAPAEARTAVAVAAAMRDDPRVVGVVGPTDSQSSINAAPIYSDVERNGARALVAVSPTSTSPVLSGRSPWLFRVCPDDAAASRAAARYALGALGARRAALVYRNDVYGKGWARTFADAFAAGGGEVVLREPEVVRVPGWAEPYAAYTRQLGADVVVFAGNSADGLTMVRALRAAGVTAPILGGDAISDVRDTSALHEFRGVRYTALFDVTHPPTATGRRFVADYHALYGVHPDDRAALAYDAAMVIGRAALAAGRDRRAVRDYLAGVGSAHPAIEGATGVIAFDARHDPIDKPVALAEVVR